MQVLINELRHYSATKPAIYLPTYADWQNEFYVYEADSPLTLETWFERVIAGAWLGDRLAYAFASGYQGALRRIFPKLFADDEIVALCVTEKGGNSPKAIETTLTEQLDGSYCLNGEKAFVTQAKEANHLAVLARLPKADDFGRKQLRVIFLERDTPGLTINVLPDLPFVPEISHGTIILHDVVPLSDRISWLDGYNSFVKPFRTAEDIYVFTGVVAYLCRLAWRYGWSQMQRECLLSFLMMLKALSQADLQDAVTHLALAGLIGQMNDFIAALDWSTVDEEVRALWERDKRLLTVASDIRAKRREAAWRKPFGEEVT